MIFINRYKAKNKPPSMCCFQSCKAIASFVKEIYEDIFTLNKAKCDQNSLVNIFEGFFVKGRRLRQLMKKKRKTQILEKRIVHFIYGSRQVLNFFRSRVFPTRPRKMKRGSVVYCTNRTRVIELEIRCGTIITSMKYSINIYQLKKKKSICNA